MFRTVITYTCTLSTHRLTIITLRIPKPIPTSRRMNNPWTLTSTAPADHPPLQPSHVAAFVSRQLLQRTREKEEAAKAAEQCRRKAYAVKERDYVTYNYTGASAGDDQMNSENTLSSILVRAMQRKVKRVELDEARKIKRLQENKRKIEEEKRRCEEAKKSQETKLRSMKEAHRLRILKERQWRAREARIATNNRLADHFRRNKLLRRYFRGFVRLITMSRQNKIKARDHYRQRTLQKALTKLRIHKAKEQLWRDQMATSFYNVCILQKFFTRWTEAVACQQDQWSRACQHHRQRLLRQYLWVWRWSALDQLLQRRQHIQMADQHYHRKVLSRGLSCWRHYTEKKNTRWKQDLVGSRLRVLVKDFLPDFSPPGSSSDEGDDDDHAKRKDERWRDIVAVMTL